MRRFQQTILNAAAMLGIVAGMAACSNEEMATATGTDQQQVPLEIEVAGVQTTRSIIEGNTLPEESQFGIFAMIGGGAERPADGGLNVRVDYMNGNCTLAQPVLIPNDADMLVYAYYPYNETYTDDSFLRQMPMETISQTDYLFGYCTDSDYHPSNVNQYNPRAYIYFQHALARVKLNIRKAADNPNSYQLPPVSLENIYSEGYFDLYERGFVGFAGITTLSFTPLNGTLLDSSDDVITVDCLVLPQNLEQLPVTLALNEQMKANLPSTIWSSGQQYTYEVTIDQGSLTISNAVITPWENNEQPGITVGEENQTPTV